MADEAKPRGSAEQRRPTADDVPAVIERVSEGKSLRAACRELGLHCPSTHTYLQDDKGRSEQYARALELRAECQQEEALTVARAAALNRKVDGQKVDAAGARVLLDAIKWSSARMAPKTAPVERLQVERSTAAMTDEDIAAEAAALQARARSRAAQQD